MPRYTYCEYVKTKECTRPLINFVSSELFYENRPKERKSASGQKGTEIESINHLA